MSGKGSFENQYPDYDQNTTQTLLKSKDAISEAFQKKLNNFKTSKLQYLTTNLQKEIFHDGTVYTGSAGLSLYYLMTAIGNPDMCNDYLQRALQYINLDNLRGKRISFLCGDAGPLAIATIISYKLSRTCPENVPHYKELTRRLLDLESLCSVSPDEILYGKSGYLYSLLFVKKYINGKDIIPSSHIEKVTSAILASGKQFSAQTKSQSPLLWQWHDKVYLGAAHGMAGILYMLLQAAEYIKSNELRLFVKPSIDWLLSLRFSSGNFPSSLGSSSGDRLVQWCHGAPGLVPLCIAAYKIFKEEKYLKIALQCGEVVWERGLCTKGYSICHGVSGNTYAFLQLYQITKKPVHLYRACCFMEWCALERPGSQLHQPDRPASLFEGLLGRIYLAEDINKPMDALFPAFCL
ncbi:unnamed protein product [Leptidea sinapis]|uniref:LanC-like protein 2 n=1 Tax=Leptidea sinapis TaxID=189913 RepID=A0A5E4R482_9NEOP|nr:unnamed protein product [Leptidea sinapis]